MLLEADAYELATVPGDFDAGLVMQWFSHVPRARYDGFLIPGAADTYELRSLPDGSSYEIVKHYFSEDDLRAIFAPCASELQVVMGEYWWWLWYTVAQ